jgi:hypothetical protein
MKTVIGIVALFSLLNVTIGCSGGRVTRTTTSRESVVVPADPVVTERRTTHTETHTNY